MSSISEQKPEGVFRYFEEICRIPHGSGNVEAISNYLVDFAKKHQLEYVQDAVKNVIIIKEATAGYENEEPVILQGHMDMVAVKTAECTKDMTKEGLDLRVEGDELFAQDTSLGGDDGIAVAYMLALLDAQDIPHPRLEAVITVDEETGMDGAKAIDLSVCRGRRLLNLDNEEEGVLLTSCAGGARVRGILPVTTETKKGICARIGITGLLGGHSGAEIDKGRANANVLMGRLARCLDSRMEIRFIDLEGGSADNAIPSSCHASVFVEAGKLENLKKAAAGLEETFRHEYHGTDPGIRIALEAAEEGEWQVFDRESTRKLISVLYLTPNGIQAMSADIPGLVQTSLNLGMISRQEQGVLLTWSVRSSMGSEKELLIDRLSLLLQSQGASFEVSGDYPAWEYKADSALREKMGRIYEEMFGAKPRIEAIHAGLECGILAGKLPGLDGISIGPDMKDIHTPGERLSISSVERVWNYILEILRRKDSE